MIKFPQFKGRELYITGESYAGHYIPAIANYILQHPFEDFNLKGIAIGNGWVDPYNQYPEFPTYAYEHNLISVPMYYALKAANRLCQLIINTGLWPIAYFECEYSYVPIIGTTKNPRINQYDIRKAPNYTVSYDNMFKFLQRDDVKKEIGVGERAWIPFSEVVRRFMLGDWITSLSDDVSALLSHGVKTLIYSGDQDFICNWRGGESWTNKINWKKSTEFTNSPYLKWKVGQKEYGELKKKLII